MRSKLFNREQVNHSPVFKTPFAQPRNMLTHEQCLRVLRFRKTKVLHVSAKAADMTAICPGSKVCPIRKGVIGMPLPPAVYSHNSPS
jgi:hypothetical protein